MKKLLVTGSSGLIGSEVCVHFAERGWQMIGLDNNQRAIFFGPQGDTRWNQRRLQEQLADRYQHIDLDIRDRQGVLTLMAEL
jgi:CDP-paratose 2-epimerase